MASPRNSGDTPKPARPKPPPARTPKARQRQLSALAFDLVELQLREGTASAPVLTHFLKLETEHAKLEVEKIKRENILLEKRSDQVDQADRIEKLLEDHAKASSLYMGHGSPEDYDAYDH